MKPNSRHPYRPDFSPRFSVDEFMDAFANNKDTFRHLQVFMSKTGKTDVGDLFLFLGKNNFGIVQLLDIDYQEDKIIIDLLDVKGNRVFKLPIDVHRREFQCMFYKLQDLRDMINQALSAEAEYHFDEGEYNDKDVADLLELDESQT